MKKDSPKMRFSLTLLPAIAVLVTALPAASWAQASPDRTVATVNGVAIKAPQYFRRMEVLPGVGRMVGGRFVAAAPGLMTLQQLVNEALLLQLAEQKGLAPTEAEIDSDLAYRKRLTPALFELYQKAGVPESDLRYDVRVQLSEFKLITQGINITDQEVEKFYQDNQAMFRSPRQIHLRMIGVSTADRQQKVDEALRQGRSFDAVAREFSEDVSRLSGGAIGAITEDNAEKAILDAVGSLKAGQTSAWVVGDSMRVRFLVEKVDESKLSPLDADLRTSVRRQMMLDRGRIRNNIGTMMREMRKNAKLDFTGTPFGEELKRIFGTDQ